MSDQCALDASGSLLDAKDIVFYESESDTRPIPKPTTSQLNVPTLSQAPVHEGEYLTVLSACCTQLTCPGRGCRPKNTTKLKQSLVAQKLNDDGQPRKSRSRNNQSRRAKKAKLIQESPSLSDDQDTDYMDAEVSDGSDSLTVSDEEEDAIITNEEV
jgi:hypothetical protein